MRQYRYVSLSAAIVAGTTVGFIDGLATLSRNLFAPHFAFLCLTVPILLTTLLALLIFPLVALANRLLRGRVEEEPARTIGQLVGTLGALWGLLWWLRFSAQAIESGGGGILFLLVALPLLGCAVTIGWVVSRLLRQLEPVTAVRWLRRGAAAGVCLNALLAFALVSTVFQEGRRFLSDTLVGTPRRPGELNLLLITIDTLRADRLAALGGPPELTPHLNRLAAEGILFTTAISPSPWTLPAVASVFTGLTPSRHGAGWSTNAFDLLARTPLPGQVWTFTQNLQSRGFLTRAIITNPYLSMRYGFGSGFHSFENVTMESEAFVALGDSFAFRLLITVWPKVVIGDIGEAVTSRAERWLERHRNEKFFLWLHYIDAHAPYGDPKRLGNKSFRGDVLRPGELRALAERSSHDGLGDRFVSMARLRAGEIHLSAEQRRQLIDLYDAGVRYDDAQVGRMLAQIERLGLREHTIVIVASDHGEEFWEHGGVEHGHTVYDELLRIPLVLRVPGKRTVTRVADVVSLVDLAPTIVELTGGFVDARIEGRSLRPLLEATPLEPRPVLSEGLLFADEKRALRSEVVKYIVSATGKEELYDLGTDPREQRDLAGRDDLVAPWRAALRDYSDSEPSAIGRAGSPVDEKTREALRVLGYGN